MKYAIEEEYKGLSPEEKRRYLFEKQNILLDAFPEGGAIAQAQYDECPGDLRGKMRLLFHNCGTTSLRT